MTKEQKQDFTRRITQANRSGLVLIKFEMLFVYMDDMETAFHADDQQLLTNNVRYADAILKSFQETLDFKYEIAGQLYALYDFHRRQLARVLMRHSLAEICCSSYIRHFWHRLNRTDPARLCRTHNRYMQGIHMEKTI